MGKNVIVGIVTINNLAVRESPSASSPTIARLMRDSIIGIYEIKVLKRENGDLLKMDGY